jgi:hypothetical protein
MSIGSELKCPSILKLLLSNLPNWPLIEKSLTAGFECPLQLLDQDIINEDFKWAINKEIKFVRKAKIEEEISHEWAINFTPLLLEIFYIHRFSPINAIEQETLTSSGDLVPKPCHRRYFVLCSRSGDLGATHRPLRPQHPQLSSKDYHVPKR